MEINVCEIRIKVKLQKDIPYEKLQSSICSFIDRALGKSPELLELHRKKECKGYSFNECYPLEEDKIYKSQKVYTITIRTVSPKLAEFFSEVLVKVKDSNFEAISSENRIIPKKRIEKVYTITSCILKNDSGYWRNVLSLEEFENRLKVNAIKKYEEFTGEKLDSDVPLYDSLIFLNRTPIATQYKEVKLLGDKINLQIADNETAQKVVYFLLGVGIMENNARGYGFLNYRWL